MPIFDETGRQVGPIIVAPSAADAFLFSAAPDSFLETPSPVWNESAKVEFGDEHIQPTWTASAVVQDTRVYRPTGKIHTVESEVVLTG